MYYAHRDRLINVSVDKLNAYIRRGRTRIEK
uniref:Uncharacterized protein n=1 Tax=Arundo donax TaxID=35708 RepID=A0A0A9BI15_ARUDO